MTWVDNCLFKITWNKSDECDNDNKAVRHLTAAELNLRHANIYDTHNLETLNTNHNQHDNFRCERSEGAGRIFGMRFLLWCMLHKYSINNCVSIVFQGSNLLISIQYIINYIFLVQRNKQINIPCLFIDDIFSIRIKFLRQRIPFLKIMWQTNPEFMMLWVPSLGHWDLFTAWAEYRPMFGGNVKNGTNNWFFHTQFTFWVAPEKSPA